MRATSLEGDEKTSVLPLVNYMAVRSSVAGAVNGKAYVFHHAADDALRDIAARYERGVLSPDQARSELAPYADLIEVPSFDVDGDVALPFHSHDVAFRPATARFEREAAALGIPGVALVLNGDVFGNRWLEVHDDAALDALRHRVYGRYRLEPGMW